MATTNPGDKLVTTNEVKLVNDKLKARIQAAEGAGGDNATAISNLQSTTATHTTDIADLKATDTTHTADISDLKTTTATHTTQIQTNATEIQGIKDSVATMAEFKQYLGLDDD